MKSPAIIFLLLLMPIQLFAHAEEPAARSIFKTQSGILIQANFGIIADSVDGYTCEEAFLGGDTWKVGVFSQTEWLTYGSDNIKRTEDGCSFETVKEIDSIVGDIRVSPDKKTVAYFANGGSEPGIWISKDRGKSFQLVDYKFEGLQITALRFSDNSTFLVSAYDTTKEGKGLLISVSMQNLESKLITIPEGVTFPYLLDANVTGIVWLGRLGEQTIFIGTAEKSDEIQYKPDVWPIGAALSNDGQQIYIGGVNDGAGIAVGQRNTGTFKTIVADHIIDCLNRVGEKIYTCGLERRDGFDVFVLENETLKGVSKFTNINGPKNDCPDNSAVSTVCPIVWNDSATYFGKEPNVKKSPTDDVDGNESVDMGVDIEGKSEEDSRISGCSTANTSSFSMLFLIGAFFFWRKKLQQSPYNTEENEDRNPT